MKRYENHSLRPYTTLRAGGSAEVVIRTFNSEELSTEITSLQSQNIRPTLLGWGSNVLPSDNGVPGTVVINQSIGIEFGEDGLVTADSGIGFQEMFLKCAQRSLGGLEFAVGIPGTLGGALVSNAGAYRSNVSEFITEVEIAQDGVNQWVEPSYLEFSYRDSLLRRPNSPAIVVTRVRMRLPIRDQKAIYDEARDYQRQRISKQPPPASAGSFFKNVNDKDLAQSLETLPEGLKKAGVVPAGYLIQICGLMGIEFRGAKFANKHANFMTNVGGAAASSIRRLAEHVRHRVHEQYGVWLEEEVLYIGDWSRWETTGRLE